MILRRPVRIRLRLEFKMVVADEDVDVLSHPEISNFRM
jgi:hypothetical protein